MQQASNPQPRPARSAPAPSPLPLTPQRLKWDAMLHRTELVEPGRRLKDGAEQVVLWHRK